jgi:hypothetical protein
VQGAAYNYIYAAPCTHAKRFNRKFEKKFMMFKKTLSLHLEKRNGIRNLFNKVLISVQRKGYTKVSLWAKTR